MSAMGRYSRLFFFMASEYEGKSFTGFVYWIGFELETLYIRVDHKR